MKMPNFTYHRPESLDEALQLLASYGSDAKVLSGGQSLIPVMALRLSQPGHLIDIGGIAGLDTIAEHDGGLRIRALVRHEQVERSPLVREKAPLLSEAMPHIGHPAIRSRGTVCGSLSHADPAAELPAVMLAVGADMVVRSNVGERVVAAKDFFVTYLTSTLEPSEMLVEVRVPAWEPGAGWSVQEVSRRHGDFALVGLASTLSVDASGAVSAAALSFFGVEGTPHRVAAAEDSLVGAKPGAAAFEEAALKVAAELDPPDDIHATGAYRRHVAAELTRRGLAEAASRLGGGV